MRRAFLFIAFVAIIIGLASCEQKEEFSQDTQSERNIVVLSDSVKQKIVEQDSMMAELLNKIDTLTAELNSAKEENASLEKKIDEIEEARLWKWISIAALLLSAIAVILNFFNGLKRNDVKEIIKEETGQHGIISRCVKNLHGNSNSTRPTLSSESNTEKRLRTLEENMKQVANAINSISYNISSHKVAESKKTPAQKDGPIHQRSGYANINSGEYFTEIFTSKQESCVFSFTFQSEKKGMFNIISLDKIKSRNDWQDAIDCAGCSITDATSFDVESMGECEKIDEFTWKVTKKLKIKLHK